MADKIVKVRVSQSQAKALVYFLEQKGSSIEAELTKSVDSIYEKIVPKEVRAYVDGTKAAPTDKSKAES